MQSLSRILRALPPCSLSLYPSPHPAGKCVDAAVPLKAPLQRSSKGCSQMPSLLDALVRNPDDNNDVLRVPIPGARQSTGTMARSSAVNCFSIAGTPFNAARAPDAEPVLPTAAFTCISRTLQYPLGSAQAGTG